jgi:hypothetical protein
MRLRTAIGFAALILTTAACSSAGGSSSDVSEALNPDTEPVTVTTTVDPSRSVSARIGPAGGALTATGADGSRYVLEVPAGALVEEIEVTMTPIESMEGLPLSEGLAAGVQLEPDGLAFYDFVTLTIEPAEEISVDQQIPIGSSGLDGAVFIPLIDPESTTVRLKLLHFSSGGVAKGYLADLAPVRQRLGGSADARLQSLIAAELARARQTQLLTGEDTLDMGVIESLMKQWKEQVLKPRLAAAGESCAAGRLAIETVLGYERQHQLLGVGDSMMGELDDLLPKVARVCVREEYELCRDEHIVHRMIPVLLNLKRQSELIGGAGMDQVIAEAEDLARRCLHFELEFKSTARMESGRTFNESEMESTIEITYDPTTLPPTVTGSSALVNLSYEVSDPEGGGCTTTGNRGGGTFEVSNLYWEVATSGSDDQLGHVEDIQLTYAPGVSTETVTATCPGTGTTTTPPNSMWSNTYMGIHQSEVGSSGGQEASNEAPPPDIPELTIEQLQALMLSGGQPGALPGGLGEAAEGPGATFTTKGWKVKGGELFAEKEWDLSLATGDVSLTEEGSFKLYHRPQ